MENEREQAYERGESKETSAETEENNRKRQEKLDNELFNLILNHIKDECKKSRKLGLSALNAFQSNQLDINKINAEFYRELHALEMKYETKLKPLYEMRADIISGQDLPSDSENVMEPSNASQQEDSADNQQKEAASKGFEKFWLTAFKNAPIIADMIEEYDEPILEHLTDVRLTRHLEPMGFTLEFHFERNEYFTNSVLTKHYELKCTSDENDGFSAWVPEIIKAKGCTIKWNKGKNVTFKTIKKKKHRDAKGAVRTVTKLVPKLSFFNFFNPPTVPENKEELDEETKNLLTNDFKVGNLLKQELIPFAVFFYMGKKIKDDVDEETEEESSTTSSAESSTTSSAESSTTSSSDESEEKVIYA